MRRARVFNAGGDVASRVSTNLSFGAGDACIVETDECLSARCSGLVTIPLDRATQSFFKAHQRLVSEMLLR